MKLGLTIFGIDGSHAPVTWPSALSFGLIRTWGTHATWWYLEPTVKGSYNWTALDAILAKAAQNGKGVIYCGYEAPQWASSNPSASNYWTYPPANPQDYQDFIAAVAQRAAAAGVRVIFEGLNEPQSTEFWNGTPAQAVAVQQALYNGAKGVDPSLTSLSPSPVNTNGPQWLADFFAAGGSAYCDAVVFHGYLNSVVPEDIAGIVGAYRSVMAAAGQSAKPLWNTEFGWGRDSNIPNDDDKAAFLARHFLMQLSLRIDVSIWYSYEGGNGTYVANNFWGTLFKNGALTKAGIADREIGGWIPPNATAGATIIQGSVYSLPIAKDASQSLAVWNTAGNSSYTAPAGYTKFKDLTGAVKSIPANRKVPIGTKPVLLIP